MTAPTRSPAERRSPIGWGSTTATAAGDFPDALRQTVIDVEPDSACADVYGSGYDASTMLCAGLPKGGRDTCQGDSGGPLVAGDPGSTVVIGFTSFGGACGQAGAPGAYVRASVAAGWLASGGATTPARTADAPAGEVPSPRRAPPGEAERTRAHEALTCKNGVWPAPCGPDPDRADLSPILAFGIPGGFRAYRSASIRPAASCVLLRHPPHSGQLRFARRQDPRDRSARSGSDPQDAGLTPFLHSSSSG